MSEVKSGIFETRAQFCVAIAFVFLLCSGLWFLFCGNFSRGIGSLIGAVVCSFLAQVLVEVENKKKQKE